MSNINCEKASEERVEDRIFRTHIFFCTNSRDNRTRSCGGSGGQDLFLYAKQKVRKSGDSAAGVRINSAGCLGRCEKGPCVVIYPEGAWYSVNNAADVDTILHHHVAPVSEGSVD